MVTMLWGDNFWIRRDPSPWDHLSLPFSWPQRYVGPAVINSVSRVRVSSLSVISLLGNKQITHLETDENCAVKYLVNSLVRSVSNWFVCHCNNLVDLGNSISYFFRYISWNFHFLFFFRVSLNPLSVSLSLSLHSLVQIFFSVLMAEAVWGRRRRERHGFRCIQKRRT